MRRTRLRTRAGWAHTNISKATNSFTQLRRINRATCYCSPPRLTAVSKEGFRSLLGLLNERFEHMDTQRLTEQQRKILAKHFVQRTRGDVLSAWPGEVRFPKRDPLEATYSLTGEHHKLFADVLAFTRETVQDPSSANRAVRYAITAPGMY